MGNSRFLPPTCLLLGLIAMALMQYLLSGPRLIWGTWRLTGGVIAALGATLTVWADALFKKLGTEVKPFRPSRLVVSEFGEPDKSLHQ